MAALAISLISAQDLSSKWRPEGCSSKLLDQSLVNCNRPNLSLRPINPRRAKIGISKRQITVRAGLSGNVGRSNCASIFVGGFILGGIMAGALGCIYAPKVSKAFAGADKKDLMRKLPKFIYDEDKALEMVPLLSSGNLHGNKVHFWGKIKGGIHHIAEELTAPPSLAAVAGFVIGVIPWLKSLIIGASAPLRVIQDSFTLLGNGTVPCSTLILGGNLTKGRRRSTVNLSTVLGTILARYVFLPVAGIAVVKAACVLRFLPQDLLYQYALLIQFALPPAMSIGTMAQLFDVGQEECSVIFLWTYLAAAPALTIWSTVFMYILS